MAEDETEAIRGGKKPQPPTSGSPLQIRRELGRFVRSFLVDMRMTQERGRNKIAVQYRIIWKRQKAESTTMGVFGYQGAIIEFN